MATLYIIRGLPGSGKSYMIDEMKVNFSEYVVCSADHFFMDNKGFYRFDPRRIAEAHEQCKIKALQMMDCRFSVVFIDNTNIRKWEYELYKEMAKAFGYQIVIKEADSPWAKDPKECFKRCVHSVPLEIIERMARDWEEDR